MARSNAFCEGEQFYCYPLSAATAEDEKDIMMFTPIHPNGAGLVAYLQHFAFPEEHSGTMRTYLVRDKDTEELAGYFSLKAGLMTVGETQDGSTVEFDTAPGVELANFAINGIYRQAHESAKGCGTNVFSDLIMKVVHRAASIIGVSVIYLFSLPDDKVIENYRQYGFERLTEEDEAKVHTRLKPRYDDQCIFMYTMV